MCTVGSLPSVQGKPVHEERGGGNGGGCEGQRWSLTNLLHSSVCMSDRAFFLGYACHGNNYYFKAEIIGFKVSSLSLSLQALTVYAAVVYLSRRREQ